MPSIKKAADLYDWPADGVPYEDANTILELKRHKGGYVPEPVAEQVGDPEVVARVDHGRWVGDCDLWNAAAGVTCRNAQVIDDADDRFFCVECHNAEVEGRWRPVTWPADIAAVETPLEELPATEQNWTPEE